MLVPDESFFFDQTPHRQIRKRYKKNADELPQSLRYGHLNPKLASFYKDTKSGDEEGPEGGEGVKDSILPEISNTFATIKNQLLSGFMPDFDSTRLALQQGKTVTPSLLEELARLLPLVKLSRKKLTYPRSLEQNLQSTYNDLVYDAKYVKRQWQLLENQMKFDAEEKEKAQKEAAATQAEETKKSKVEFSDSDEEMGKGESADVETGRSKGQRRRKHRHTQSQPAVIIEEDGGLRKVSSQGRRPRTNSSATRKPTTAPGKPDNMRLSLPRGVAEDALSEASHSIKSGYPSAHPQPYSVTVLAFNLANYHTWEDKGCHVFGIDKSANNEHPLEWVVKRLNQTSSQIKFQQNEASKNNHTELPYTRYYTETFNEKNLLKSATDRLGIFNTVMKGGKPRIPNLNTRSNKGQILMTQIVDGSKTLYYESGETAIVVSHSGDRGFYTLCYDKDSSNRMLASFTPLGTGCCYSAKNNPILLVTEDGGFFATDEDEVEEWTWPAEINTKLSSPITIPLNRNMSIKIVSRSSITLTFQSAGHTIKLPVGLTEGLEASNAPLLDDLFPLQTTDKSVFTSQAAQELIQRQKVSKAPSTFDKNPSSMLRKSRNVRTPKRDDNASVDFSDSATIAQVQFDGSKVERDLSRLKNKAKTLVDDWLDTYRMALGMTSPQIKNMKLSADWSRRGLHTAKSLPPDPQNSNADELATTPIPVMDSDRSTRIPSAPSGFGPWIFSNIENSTNDAPSLRLSSRQKTSNTLRQSKSSSVKLPAHRDKPIVVSSDDSPKLQGLISEWTVANHYQCPVALRQQLLGHAVSGPHICKCTRRRVPYITDIELETFISQIVPRKQLVVLSIVSSLYPEKNSGAEMLDRLHNERNANRTHVCMQSKSDTFRVFRYDVVTAYFDSTHNQPLLLTRHNAVPGMFLIFQGGKLVFCDHIFNGYGNAKRDFQKQLVDCKRLAHRGFSLPPDFKFSPQKGKQGPRSPWGGQIGGAGVDKYGNPGTSMSMPRIELKDGNSSPDSMSSLEYHIGKNMSNDVEEDVDTAKTLVSRLSKRYTRFMPPVAVVK